MGDLYGAIAMPPKVARTIVYGTEKICIERLLNILTYFIRCGEVRRSSKREDFNKEKLATLVRESKNEPLRKSGGRLIKKVPKLAGGGLTRTSTCKQNLNTIADDDCELEYEDINYDDEDENDAPTDAEIIKKNEIPTVLAFRDSRFVQQELRIGNYLMDTGIEKKSLQNKKNVAAVVMAKEAKDDRIKLMVTSPEEETQVLEENSSSSGSCGSSSEDGVMEAIEMDSQPGSEGDAGDDCVDALVVNNKKNFFWNMVPQSVKDGLSLMDLEKLRQRVYMFNHQMDRRGSSYSTTTLGNESVADDSNAPNQKRHSHISLSDLITQNSMGKTDRMTWGVEPVKEKVSLEEQIHFDYCQKLVERERGVYRKVENPNVVFVLGDNEPLVNLKKSTEDLATIDNSTPTAASSQMQMPKRELCALHQQSAAQSEGSQTASLTASGKKHSAFKFNFEQYPQIVTNYMRSKNLVMSNYDLLMDKCSKLEAQEAAAAAAAHGEAQNIGESKMNMPTSCIVCNKLLNAYQTPSNATELDEDETRAAIYQQQQQLHAVSSAASMDTLKSVSLTNTNECTEGNVAASDSSCLTPTSSSNLISSSLRKTTFNGNAKKISSHRSSTSSVAAKCAAINDSINLMKLPIPGIKELPQEDEPAGDMKLRAGFIPSLFLSVNDHYISDMVLQVNIIVKK